MAHVSRLAVSRGWAITLGMFWFAVCLLGFYGLLWAALGGGA